MPKKKTHNKKEDKDLDWENELGIPEETEDFDEVVLNREEAEDLLEKIEKLKSKLKKVEKEKMEYLDGWQRSRVELAKLQKREESAMSESRNKGKRSVIMEFLPVADSFDMAFSNAEAWNKVDESWRRGVEYISAQLHSAFEREGVQAFDPKGEAFDPKRHDSLDVVPVSNKDEDHHVVEVIQKGYEMKGEVIRPAKVKVGEFKG